MKPLLLPFALAALLAGTRASAQTPSSATVQVAPLTKFNLDFPGGTPAQLVAAIEKSTGRPLNAIILPEDADTALPPMKMSNVDAVRLFGALRDVTTKNRFATDSGGFASTYTYGTGFRTESQPTDDSVWWFFVTSPPPRPPAGAAQFFLLTPYLERGLTVDDVTTAIQTAWKMQGGNSGASLRYHKETNLLIAVGGAQDIAAIHSALGALASAGPRDAAAEQKAPAPKKP